MHEQSPVLVGKKREKTGSRYSRRVRDAGGLPAIVYGHGETPVAIELDAHETLGYLNKGEKVFELDIDGAKQHVLLKDLGYGYLGDNIVHADFARVSLDERVNTRAHLRFVGESVGLKSTGAVLMHPITEIELNCLVTNLPDHIDVDITDLDVGGSITAGDVKLPVDTMKLLTSPGAVVAHIVIQIHKEEDTTTEEGEISAEEGAEPEVIGEKAEDKDAEAPEGKGS